MFPNRSEYPDSDVVERMGLIDMLEPMDENIPFPSLETLQVRFRLTDDPPLYYLPGSSQSLQTLARLLSSRSAYGHKLEKLRIIGVRPESVTAANQATMKELSRLVGQWEVDTVNLRSEWAPRSSLDSEFVSLCDK